MAAYLFIEGIEGQSVDADHAKWINLLSISESMSRPVSFGGSGSSRNTSSVSHGEIMVAKELDKSTPKLIEAVNSGKTLATVKIDMVQSLGDTSKRLPYMQWELKNVLVTSYSISGSGMGGDVPTESLSLNFEEAKWVYTQYSKEGKNEGKVETTWKVEEGTT